MKNSSVFLSVVLLLFFCSSNALAQRENKSAINSPVITTHHYSEVGLGAFCPQYGPINGLIFAHVIEQALPNGDLSLHMNFNGEATDLDGGIWTFKDTWIIRANFEDGFWVENDHGFLFGPNGEKLKLQLTVVWNRKDKNVQFIFDPMCY